MPQMSMMSNCGILSRKMQLDIDIEPTFRYTYMRYYIQTNGKTPSCYIFHATEQTDRQTRDVYKSPLCNLHRWAQKRNGSLSYNVVIILNIFSIFQYYGIHNLQQREMINSYLLLSLVLLVLCIVMIHCLLGTLTGPFQIVSQVLTYRISFNTIDNLFFNRFKILTP